MWDMEHILNENSVKSKKMTLLAYVVSTAMIFGVMNPVAYITDRDTPKEISSMGKAVNFEMPASASGKRYSRHMAENVRMISMEKGLAGNAMLNSSVTDINNICNQILIDTPVVTLKKEDTQVKHDVISERKPVDQIVDSKMNHGENVLEDTVRNSVTDIGSIAKPAGDDADSITPGVIENPIQEVTEEPAYIELRGMKIDSEGYVTAITDGVSDGLLVFPTDIRCKGIRAEAVENLESDLKDEVTEIWIPANITYIEEGTFNSLKNVNFIETAEENPVYYSETGILYHKDGSVVCMPQRRIR